jgi:indolepyruvate ferredoxin oxidoreductase
MSLATVTLDDKYTLDRGRIFVTGTQALVRLPMMQRQRDAAAGRNTACFISGYRGSPLGAYDQSLWRAKQQLKDNHIHFEPGVNEDLAATAVWGSQQTQIFPGSRYDGVFGIWYGKGPGVDRSVDVIRHANLAGTSPHGGVLMLIGDDHGASSSTTAHQSELTLQSISAPMLHAANVQEYLDYGQIGIALSRFAGLWVGFKCLTSTVESSASIDVDSARLRIVDPEFAFPPGGTQLRMPDNALDQERRLLDFKLPAALAFARANRIDRVAIGSPVRRLGIVTTGKSYLDVREALDELHLSEARCAALGIAVYKVGMVWPLEPEGIRAFCEGLEEVIVIEEKRPVIEPQLKDLLFHLPADRRPRITGKQDETGRPLLHSNSELTPAEIVVAIAARLKRFHDDSAIEERLAFLRQKAEAQSRQSAPVARPAWFCAGCPHNTSTKVPDGSRAVAGIGCHYMVQWMDRSTASFTQMGGEGVPWLGQAPFTDEKHVFANLGDGTYFHSGILAIRAAVAARANVTYKLLYNDAVAMTGGQQVEGNLTVPNITLQLYAEGVSRIVVVADDPHKYVGGSLFAPGVTFHPREELDEVQRELRETPGVTALIYDQTCAAEKRRRRKRGTYPDPDLRAFINDRVCEGCGDCSVQSNCVAVEPLETEFGRKRKINQSACNKDFSCVNGFCPSFVTVTGATPHRNRRSSAGQSAIDTRLASLPAPALPALDRPCDVLVTGIGGTGVVTISAVLGMAAHLEGKGVSVLDQTGLAQKNGAVASHVRIGATPADLHAVRIATGACDVLLGCDIVVAAAPSSMATYARGATAAVVNSHITPTADFTLNPDMTFGEARLTEMIRESCGANRSEFLDATTMATALLGDAIATNMFLLGHAIQRGLIPVSVEALERAIEINGAAIEANKRALRWGRLHAIDPQAVERAAAPPVPLPVRPKSLDEIVEHRVNHLTAWQDAAWALRYRGLVDLARRAEEQRARGLAGFAEAVALNAAKLMSYKDEYEVARLYTDGDFRRKLRAEFDGDLRLTVHLAPPLISRPDPITGKVSKRAFGPWVFTLFRLLAPLKRLRGTPLDLFGYSAERRMERRLVDEFEALVRALAADLSPQNHGTAVKLAALPGDIRGYGHIKEQSITRAKQREAELLAVFRVPAPRAAAAE